MPTAVRETSVSQHHGAKLRISLKPLRHYSTIILVGSRGPHNWAPIMLRYATLSDTGHRM